MYLEINIRYKSFIEYIVEDIFKTWYNTSINISYISEKKSYIIIEEKKYEINTTILDYIIKLTNGHLIDKSVFKLQLNQMLNLVCHNKLEKSHFLNIDVFGVIVFYLCQVEEIFLTNTRDKHGRFLREYSLIDKQYYNFPVVDILVHSYLKLFYSDKIESRSTYNFNLTFDLDRPNLFDNTLISKLKYIYNFFFNRAKFNFIKNCKKKKTDPYINELNYIKENCIKYNIKPLIYLMNKTENHIYNHEYDINDIVLSKILLQFKNLGCKFGFHPSYLTSKNNQLLIKQLVDLNNYFNIYDVRYHYLRYNANQFKILNELGIKYDSSISFPDYAGFKCGTSRLFKLYDIKNKVDLNIVEKPLLIMDCTLGQSNYMNLDLSRSISHVHEIKKYVQLYNGTFTVLFHNHILTEKYYKDLFNNILSNE